MSSMALRIRSSLPTLRRALSSQSNPNFSSRNFATSTTAAAPPKKDINVKVPVSMFGGCANYASALYISAVKDNSLDKVESELVDLVEAIKNSPGFSQFTRDPTVPKDTRAKVLTDICTEAKFSKIMKNFLLTVADNGRLKHLDGIAKRFVEITMAHRGEVKAIVTTVIPLPAAEEKELKETLQEILGAGVTIKLEQKIDPSILGGLVVEFSQKMFDMSIKTRAKQMERFIRESFNT